MRSLMITVFCFLLAACCLFPQQESCDDCNTHYARCMELKRQIVMCGAASNQLDAMQQRAELARLQKSYRDECC